MDALRNPVVVGQLLYGVEQAACVLGLSPRLVWEFVNKGEIKSRRVGTRVLIHRKELEKFAQRDHATQPEDKVEAAE
jgi:excisionase family DNA binding protein